MPQKKKETDGVWKRVEVVWIDSVSLRISGKTWHSAIEVACSLKDGTHIRTSGYQFDEDENYIAVAASMTMEDDMPVLFGEVMLIPKGCILLIENI